MNAVVESSSEIQAITIRNEPFSAELFAEMLPLARQCWAESTALKVKTCAFDGERDIAIEPDAELYEQMAKMGLFVMVTLRDGARLVGYVEGFLYRSPHHRQVLCGNGDSVYVEPAYRGHASALVGRFEREMQALGAGIIGWPTHPEGPVYKLLKARGYVSDDVVMEKRLCVSH